MWANESDEKLNIPVISLMGAQRSLSTPLRCSISNFAVFAISIRYHRNIEFFIDQSSTCSSRRTPEHGFLAFCRTWNMGERVDEKLNIPVISLYGDHKDSLKLQSSHLAGVDVLLCDLQDIGSRYYTFHCTIAWAMAACAETHIRLVVIDRPNPINGLMTEGNLVREANFSFVGAYPLLNRHGFTMGELVHYVRDIYHVNLDCEIVWMKNYVRSLHFDELDLPFIPPSPNMPTLNTAMVYPGMCLIEGTNLSEGRGTCTPFELVGAPYINDPEDFKEKIDRYQCEGVITRACHFKPKFQKHADKNCGGIFIHIVDRKKFLPLRFAICVIAAAMTYEGFDWRREAYEFETGRLAIDLLLGDNRIRDMLEKQRGLSEIFALFGQEEEQFRHVWENYLHYSFN